MICTQIMFSDSVFQWDLSPMTRLRLQDEKFSQNVWGQGSLIKSGAWHLPIGMVHD